MTIRKVGGKYEVVSKKGKNLSKPMSRSAAKKRLRQVEYFKHKKGSTRIDLLMGLLVIALALFALLFAYAHVFETYAANNLVGSPYRIDTFGSDVTISASTTWVDNITITAYTTAKTTTFIDDDGNKCLVLECPAGYTISWPPDDKPKLFSNGINFDDSASDLAANDLIFVFLGKRGD